jgi:succinoglycan biosynthesis protein ExoL
LRFLGPYKNPDDLAPMYTQIHFTWTIDRFEEGLNSSWLLPNRLYEGGLYGSVPIAEANVETGRFLKNLGIGVLLAEFNSRALAEFFHTLTPERYRNLEAAVMHIPQTQWIHDTQDCKDLVVYLSSLRMADDSGSHSLS